MQFLSCHVKFHGYWTKDFGEKNAEYLTASPALLLVLFSAECMLRVGLYFLSFVWLLIWGKRFTSGLALNCMGLSRFYRHVALLIILVHCTLEKLKLENHNLTQWCFCHFKACHSNPPHAHRLVSCCALGLQRPGGAFALPFFGICVRKWNICNFAISYTQQRTACIRGTETLEWHVCP